jgi:uncharacterized protein YjiS (DUF1127 family)
MAQATAFGVRPERGSIADRLRHAARQAWAAYWTWRAQHATATILHALDDRTLKDIGVDRSEIESVVWVTRAKRKERRIGVFR